MFGDGAHWVICRHSKLYHTNFRFGSISEFITSWITGSGVRQLAEPEDNTKSSLPSSQFGQERNIE
jgi:hypothetical protein